MGCSRTFFLFLFAWIISRSFVVGLFGLVVGIWLDRRDAERFADRRHKRMEQIRSTFLLCMMGAFAKIAKADGRVSATEIEAISRMLDEWGLRASDVILAQDIFRKAKDDDVLFIAYVRKFAEECPGFEFRIIFLQCLVRLAYAEGKISTEQMRMLRQAESIFGLPPGTLHMLISQFTSDTWASSGRYTHNEYARRSSAPGATDDDYAALGLTSTATGAEIKKAYRRKAMELHPDKIQAKGLPPEFIKVANDQLAFVNVAYDRICRTRDLK